MKATAKESEEHRNIVHHCRKENQEECDERRHDEHGSCDKNCHAESREESRDERRDGRQTGPSLIKTIGRRLRSNSKIRRIQVLSRR